MLYHGTNLELKILEPQLTHSPREMQRIGGKQKVFYASEHYQEALVHGISKALNLEAHAGYRNNGNAWSISIPSNAQDIHSGQKIYIYEFDESDFKKTDLDEWYADKQIYPIHSREITIGEALTHFDEIKFLGREGNDIQKGKERWL